MKKYLSVLFLFCLMACHFKKNTEKTEHQVMGINAVEVNVPNSVWKSIEKDFVASTTKEKKEESEEPKKESSDKEYLNELMKRLPPTETFPFTVELLEKTEGVLDKKNYILDFPSGGGVLDLASFVSESPLGSFYFKLHWDEKKWPLKNLRVYMVPKSKIRSFEDKKLGSGCRHFLNITDYWKSSMGKSGFFLNTNNLRHISLLAGTYYFNVFKEGKIYWASLEVLDSRHRDLLCVP